MTGIADVVISESAAHEHDQAFIKMLKATWKWKINLHSGKWEFKYSSVDFIVIHGQRKVINH